MESVVEQEAGNSLAVLSQHRTYSSVHDASLLTLLTLELLPQLHNIQVNHLSIESSTLDN